MRRSYYIAIASLLIVISLVIYVFFVPAVNSEYVIYELKAGASKKTLIDELKQKNIVRSPLIFSLMIYPLNNSQLKAGEYLFKKDSTLFSIWQQITNGTGLVKRPFIIIPGWTFKQLRQALNETEGLNHLTQQLTDKEIMEKLGATTLAAEGEFFPETYYYTKHVSDLFILKAASHMMQKKLEEAWANRSVDLPFNNKYEALIAASLIEKEAYMDYERSVIGGVLVNRLKKDMLLQFDPTVIYGLGEKYTGKIYKDNLQEDTPYNTYVHKGLPPTPIALPSLASILAATKPEKTTYYYFVARGDGSHQFSENLIQHHAAVAREVPITLNFFNDAKLREIIKTMMSS